MLIVLISRGKFKKCPDQDMGFSYFLELEDIFFLGLKVSGIRFHIFDFY